MDQELVQYLNEQFAGINERFEQVDQRFEQVGQHFEQVDQRFEQIDRRFEEMRREMSAGFDEVKRHNGVLVEDLRYKLQLVAEGFATHIEVRHTQDREYFDRQFADTHALIRCSYDHLNQRIENLERKGQD